MSCEAPSTGFNALASLAGLAATCVWDAADQVVHAGLHLYASMPLCIFMHAGLLAGRRALGEVSRTAVGQVPSLTAAGRQSFLPRFLCCRLTVSVRERFWKEGHAMARCWLLFAAVTRKQHIFCDPARVVWVARRVVTTTDRHRTSVIQTDLVWSGLIS